MDAYKEPLVSRYTSQDMQYIFSDEFKFKSWRSCWIALAEAQKELGLERITESMIDEMKAVDTIDYQVAKDKEKEIRHDVLAHIYEFGTHCPEAKGIIHLGATSMYVNDNTELIQMREALELAKTGIVNTIANMAGIADTYKDTVTLGFTHYQPAQPTTMGKRMTLYIQDLAESLEHLDAITLKARGAKGTLGTQASYYELFGDYEKVKQLDRLVAQKLGFSESYPVTGQTYPRASDIPLAAGLGYMGVALHKFGKDIRLMAKDKLVDEPFQVHQKGSSAMPYKKNPMRSERLCGLSRKLVNLLPEFYHIPMDQWLERTLDDSAARRMDIPQAFLLADACLMLANNITDRNVGQDMRPLTFYEQRIQKVLQEDLPFLCSEQILMDLVEEGHDRQELHTIMAEHASHTQMAMKDKGIDNDFFRRLEQDPRFPATDLTAYLEDPQTLAWPAPLQVTDYLQEHVKPLLKRHKHRLGKANSQINV
ncbi:MAG: adenylosuccinate lyase [Nanobdellota archaeon]